ncbi:hypothetical protein BGW42_007671 [Actinomortierella wolfii]|nr:hypothetical protein BGW42_007671 [Actinomortierella wolfii]
MNSGPRISVWTSSLSTRTATLASTNASILGDEAESRPPSASYSVGTSDEKEQRESGSLVKWKDRWRRSRSRSLGRHGGSTTDVSKSGSESERERSLTSCRRARRRDSEESRGAKGIQHALRVGFMSTLGPGIPITPTVSVFGEQLANGMFNKNNPGGLFGYSREEEKRLVRKIDYRLLPILGTFYAFSTLNRANLTNARIFAYESALHATNEQYAWAIAIFYCGFGLAEIPSIFALLYLTPKIWLPLSMFACEQTFRLAILSLFNSASGAFGGLVAGAIGLLHGVAGLDGWQWVFILESIPTAICAVAAYFILAKTPEAAPWLNQRETSIAIYRIRNDTKIKVNRTFSKKTIMTAVKDPKVYLFMSLNLILTSLIPSNSTVINNNNNKNSTINSPPKNTATPEPDSDDETMLPPIDTTSPPDPGVAAAFEEMTVRARILAQLLSSPPYFFGGLLTFAVAVIVDRTQQRAYMIVALSFFTICGYACELITTNVHARYTASFIIYAGQSAMMPVATSWLTTNVGGYAKRAIAVAIYQLGASLAGRWRLARANYRRSYSVAFGLNPIRGLSKAEIRDLGDNHPAYRYTL